MELPAGGGGISMQTEDLCWGDRHSDNPWMSRGCNHQAETPVGLCLEHYDEIALGTCDPSA